MSCHAGEFSVHTHNRIALSILVVAITMIAEVIGGIVSNSLALISEAGHMFTDLVVLALSWIAYKFAMRKSDARKSYGYHRLQVVAAFINGLSLFVIAVLIVLESIKRLIDHVEINWQVMLVVSLFGFCTNMIVFLVLYKKGESNLNIKSAVLHVISDLLGSTAAIASSIVIMLTGWQIVDPLLSIFVSTLMFFSAYKIIQHSGNILLEGKPDDIDPEEVRSSILGQVSEVVRVHHVHLWSLTTNRTIGTMHVTVNKGEVNATEHSTTLNSIKKLLREKFGICHVTIEVEYGEQTDTNL